MVANLKFCVVMFAACVAVSLGENVPKTVLEVPAEMESSPSQRRASYESSDFQPVRNSVYDVSKSEGKRQNATFDYDPLVAAFPKRMALRVENQRSEFNACGGFSGGPSGTCCSACVKLGYRRGCWCRTWDCLCYDA